VFSTSPNNFQTPSDGLLCTAIGRKKKSWLMDLAMEVTELWKTGIFIDSLARDFVK